MAELRGLANIIRASDTLHGIEAPPKPDDYVTYEKYRAALDEWYARTTLWHATLVDRPD
jgi:hypothetical protein